MRETALVADLGYIEGRGVPGRLAMRVTRFLRARTALRYLPPDLARGGRHLDIGCGDGYFLQRSPAAVRHGMDRLTGQAVEDGIPFADGAFDVVTMLAVIEHLDDPAPVIEDIDRVLAPGGRLVLTTPKRAAEWIIGVYARDIGEAHTRYYTLDSLKALAGERFDLVAADTFCLGLNQVICFRKRAPAARWDGPARSLAVGHDHGPPKAARVQPKLEGGRP
jgi:SAM-dependent methyltransferase